MKIAIYSRDDQGLVTYVGSHWWPSLQDLLVYHFREDDQPEHDILVGWPHKYVTWYRGLGIGSHSAPTPAPSPEVQGADSVAAAVNIGDATFSEPDEEIPSFFLAFVNEDGIDKRVLNSSHADKSKVETFLYDRVANKESFPGEYVAFGTVNDWNTVKISAFNSGIITLKGENDYTIHISGERGHFEKDGEAIGGLWFADRTLIDHDGTFSLPKSVAKALRDAGYEVSEDFI